MAGVMFFLAVASSCNGPAADGQAQGTANKLVAKVFGKEVTSDELHPYLLAANNKADSTRLAKEYLEGLVVEMMLAEKQAGLAITDPIQIEKKVEQYRRQLQAIDYQQAYLKEKLDTVVTKDQVKDFYTRHPALFVLHSDIYRGYYIMVPANVPRIGRLKDLLASDKPSDFAELKSICTRYARSFSIDRTTWAELPNAARDLWETQLAKQTPGHNTTLLAEKDEYVYMLRIIDYKFAKQTAPIAYIESQTKWHLLNRRRTELLDQLKEQLLDEAKKDKKIEIL